MTAGEGEFTIKPLVFDGERLEINARTAGDEGRVTVEVLDASTGEPLAGFGREDCDAFQGNSIAHAVTWGNRRSLVELAEQPVRLRFQLPRAKLFAFQFQSRVTACRRVPICVWASWESPMAKTLEMSLHGTNGHVVLSADDPFFMMRSLPGDFVSMVRTGQRPVELMKETVAVCLIMIGADIFRREGGRRIRLDSELRL